MKPQVGENWDGENEKKQKQGRKYVYVFCVGPCERDRKTQEKREVSMRPERE